VPSKKRCAGGAAVGSRRIGPNPVNLAELSDNLWAGTRAPERVAIAIVAGAVLGSGAWGRGAVEPAEPPVVSQFEIDRTKK
jgi:hypothetical protein